MTSTPTVVYKEESSAPAVVSEDSNNLPTTEVTVADKALFLKSIETKAAELSPDNVVLTVAGLGPWSNSKYKSLKKCPFQYFLKYVLKFKVPDKFQTQSDPTSANVGKAAHEILEHVMLGKTVDQAYVKAKKEYVDKNVLSPVLWEEKVEKLRYNITMFKERIEAFDRKNKVKRVLTELRIGINKNLEAVGFFADDVWLRGVVDLVFILECNDAIIIDHKTGGGQGPITPYEEQLDWYKVLYHYGIDKIRGAQSGIHFIGEGDIKLGRYTPKEDIEGNIIRAIEISLEGAIEMLKEKGYFKHVRGNYCKWCEYDNIGCKEGLFKPIELASKRFIPIQSA